MIEKGFSRGNIDTKIFIKIENNDMLLAQIYIDDIIFGATNESLYKEFAKCMRGEFEMIMIRELNYFLGLQIKQLKKCIFINQAKYIKDLIKKFGMENAKPVSTPMSTSTKYSDGGGNPVDIKHYRSMIGSFLYLTVSRPDIVFSV